MKFKFKTKHDFEKRSNECQRIKRKYPDRCPIICEMVNDSNLGKLDKQKYLVPQDLTVGQFIYVIRKRIKLSAEQSLFLFINGTLPPTSASLSLIYAEHKDDDGFLYVAVSGESTFG